MLEGLRHLSATQYVSLYSMAAQTTVSSLSPGRWACPLGETTGPALRPTVTEGETRRDIGDTFRREGAAASVEVHLVV